jgi:hypothetical protein
MESIVELLSYKAAANESKIQAFQGDVKVWMNSNGTCSFPEIPVVRGQKFSKCFHKKAHGYLLWKPEMENFLVNKISEEYSAFEVSNNSLSYNDLITLTLKILLDEEYGKSASKITV